MITTNSFTTENYMKAVDELKAIIAKQDAEIERMRIHYDGTIMYGNRLVDLIDWAERNGIVFPAKIYNPCVIAIDHFRNERERLKESDNVSE